MRLPDRAVAGLVLRPGRTTVRFVHHPARPVRPGVQSRPRRLPCGRPIGQFALATIVETIEEFAEFIDVTSQIKLLNDSKDDFLLSLSIDGNVDYLITGDKELIAVGQYGKTVVINFTDFMQKIRNE